MALVKLGNKAAGSVVKLKENGTPVDYIVVHQGLPGSMYDASCNGSWLLRKEIAEKRQWHVSNTNGYDNTGINAYLNGDWLDRFESSIRAKIKQVKLPYCPGGSKVGSVNSGSNGMSTRVFPLSYFETGQQDTYNALEDGSKLDYFISGRSSAACAKRIAYFNGSATTWGLRTFYPPSSTIGSRTHTVNASGDRGYVSGSDGPATFDGLRPAMILPVDLWVTDDGTVTTNTAPTMPPTITVPAQVNGGSTVTISWGTSTDAEDNLEGYKAERSLDGGTTWAQIYQGSAQSAAGTVPFGSESVMYRVKAYDAEGLESGWKTSGQVTVINNTAPTVPGHITVPEQVRGGGPLVISWGASSDGENNLAGYSLERQVDGGEWAVIYTGDQLSFTDQITKGWQTVAYRVRAYDSHSAYSGFASSETRQVNNNTPPAITCDPASGTNLGVKSEGFEVPYSVADEEGDGVTVTEAVDGAAWRAFAVELGAENRFVLGGVDFMKLLNGRHTLSITADDGVSSAVHSLSFTKSVTAASVTLAQPMAADGPIGVCVLAVSGFIPLDADFTVEVANNANDEAPAWEDCTAAVRGGVNYAFENKAAANGFAFNFRLKAERGGSGIGGYITSVQGGFQ